MKPRLAMQVGLAAMLVLSICLQTVAGDGVKPDDDDYHYADDYDDEYDDYTEEDSDKSLSSTSAPPSLTTKSTTADPRRTSSTTTTTTTTAAPLWSDEDDANESYPCPKECSCEDDTRFLNCSQRALTEIPADLPPNVIRLDLAANNIKHIPVEALQNCTELRELLLDRNVIEQIDVELFMGLNHLDVLSLAGNLLEHLTPDTFSKAQSLRRLVLSENPLVIPDEGSFLQQPELEELEMANCNLTEVTQETFAGLEALKSLNLAGNMFDEDLSTDVFEPLANLQRLHMPPLSEDTVRDLCDVVKSIDVVDITTHNVSCFYLASETSYEESIITPRPSTPEPKIISFKDLPELPDPSPTTLRPPKRLMKTENEIDAPTSKEESKTTPLPKAASTRRSTTTSTRSPPTVSGPSSASITHAANESGDDVTKTSKSEATTGESGGEESMLASISSETMKQLLMGIIGAGIGILLIGIICRRTGLKNKFCGSKRRPAPTDQVRPAEEVPLNKV